MIKINDYTTLNKFVAENRKYIFGNYLAHYHLIERIKALDRGQGTLHKCYIITDDHDSALGLWSTHGYMVYSDHWNSEILQALTGKIELDKYSHLTLCGQSDLVKDIFKHSDVTGKIFKNRFIEACTFTNPPIKPFSGEGRNANLGDFEELSKMNIHYYREEFEGQGARSENSIINSVIDTITEQSCYLWCVGEQIVSMVNVINYNDDHAILGGLYTKPEYRGHGYAYFLMRTVTKSLLEDAGYLQCGVVSDAENEKTKSIFSNVGYTPIYRWTLMVKK